ncbi:MAG: hypothetical protein IJR57_01840 [Ruminococcus sp.]|nr:hypothetical protein [Ruminococcus sp.]
MMRTNNMSRRATERARAITAQKKASAKKKRIIVSVVALTLVIVAAASFIFVGAANKGTMPVADKPSVTRTADKAAAPINNTAKPVVQKAIETVAQSVQNNAAQNNTAAVNDVQPADTDTYTAPVQQNDNNATETTAPQQNVDRIDEVNGERIYIDTKRVAPEVTGTPAHYYANGKTSYGFDWNYKTDNVNFVLRCDYNFNQQQYDFQFYGTTPGTAHVTLLYNTDDNVQVPVNLTVTVDDGLNVSVA